MGRQHFEEVTNMRKKFSDTKLLVLVLYVIISAITLFIVSGALFQMHLIFAVLVLAIDLILILFCSYINIQLLFINEEYRFVPFKKSRLEEAYAEWLKSIKEIHFTQDFGMCCSERAAFKCSKEHCFRGLEEFADGFIQEQEDKGNGLPGYAKEHMDYLVG